MSRSGEINKHWESDVSILICRERMRPVLRRNVLNCPGHLEMLRSQETLAFGSVSFQRLAGHGRQKTDPDTVDGRLKLM